MKCLNCSVHTKDRKNKIKNNRLFPYLFLFHGNLFYLLFFFSIHICIFSHCFYLFFLTVFRINYYNNITRRRKISRTVYKPRRRRPICSDIYSLLRSRLTIIVIIISSFSFYYARPYTGRGNRFFLLRTLCLVKKKKK